LLYGGLHIPRGTYPAAATNECADLVPDSPALPDDIIQLRRDMLACLESLLKAEREIELPDGGEIDADVEAETADPGDEPWLLDTSNGIYPGECDVDHTEARA